MKKLVYTSVFVLLLFSCKGNGQNTNPITSNDDSEGGVSNAENNVTFSGDYNDLLTLEMAARVTGFEASKAQKLNTGKGMMSEILRYYWENGREVVKEKSVSNRKRVTYPRSDLVQISFVDFEADKDSFLDFVSVETHPELTKTASVGEAAYWNSTKNYLEVYSNGVSFRAMVEISNDENINKGKTIELAQLIIEERIN